MKNYKNKLGTIKTRWARVYLTALVKSILFFEWFGSRTPAQMIAPASFLLALNMAITLGVYQSVYAFFLFTLVIISIATAPMLFKTRSAHWLGKSEHVFFNDVVVYSVLQIVLGAQAHIITQNAPKIFPAMLFISFLVSIICLFIFKSYVWLRLVNIKTKPHKEA